MTRLPIRELDDELQAFLEPVTARLPEKRLRYVLQVAVQGIIAQRSPLVTQIARGIAHKAHTIWSTAKRLYRFMRNERFSHRDLAKGMYEVARLRVAEYSPAYLVVALDPVNFEKPYTRALEGVSTVMKSTPPGPKGDKRLTSGYPAITATVVNLPEPVVSYADWFSYETADFVSENSQIKRAIRTTRTVFPQAKLRFVGDAGLDDQKFFRYIARVNAEFIMRAGRQRVVDVYNPQLDRWEGGEALDELAASVPWRLSLEVAFRHARKVRKVKVKLGWLKIRLPETQQVVWVLVAHDPDFDHALVLITNVPIHSAHIAQWVYRDWRYRPHIEDTYRFDQEEGLDIERIQVHTLERMRRLFILVLLAALFVYHVDQVWPQPAVLWLRRLGGKLGHASDLDGPYVLLQGIAAVWTTVATLTFAQQNPFPRPAGTCG